jgi:hypothetical protein
MEVYFRQKLNYDVMREKTQQNERKVISESEGCNRVGCTCGVVRNEFVTNEKRAIADR